MIRPKNREEYRNALAEMFVGALEEKGLQWRKEWRSSSAPCNGATGYRYRGANALYLSLVAMANGYTDPRWVTLRQVADEEKRYHPGQKWHLKAGSKAVYVEYWFPVDLKTGKTISWTDYRQELQEGRPEKEFSLAARYSAVFNAQQVEGMPEPEVPKEKEIHPDLLIAILSDEMAVPVLYTDEDRACYSPVSDCVLVPKPEKFSSDYALNATILHELSHATGHVSRLHRDLDNTFGTEAYAYEELVAEICACFEGSELDTTASPEHMENHKAYVQSWIQTVREKPETLMKAIRDAQTAAHYLDWKAGRITYKEYERRTSGVRTPIKEPEYGRAR